MVLSKVIRSAKGEVVDLGEEVAELVLVFGPGVLVSAFKVGCALADGGRDGYWVICVLGHCFNNEARHPVWHLVGKGSEQSRGA